MLILAALIISACVMEPGSVTTLESPIGMPNPASQHCVDQSGKLEIRDASDRQTGYCLFPDGSECEEWAFFRGECALGEPKGSTDRSNPVVATTGSVMQSSDGYRFVDISGLLIDHAGVSQQAGSDD